MRMDPTQQKTEDSVYQLFNLSGRTVVVTGACGFLGQTFVRGLLRAEARVIMLSRSDEIHRDRGAYAAEFSDSQISAHQIDFYDRGKLEETLQRLIEAEPVDVLINNAYDMSPRTGFN